MPKNILLTKGQIAVVDDEDFDWINQWKWFANENKTGYYAARWIRQGTKRKLQYMHKLILGIKDDGVCGDHKDGNKLNNVRDNLRIATHSENMRNVPVRHNTLTGYKGVKLDKRKGKYMACINVDGKRIFLGYFDYKVAASRAYDRAAIKYHKEFARINNV